MSPHTREAMHLAELGDDAGLLPPTLRALELADEDRTLGAVAARVWRATYGDSGVLGQHLGEPDTELAAEYLVGVVRRIEAILLERAEQQITTPLETFVFELAAEATLPAVRDRVAACLQLGIRTGGSREDALAADRLLVAVGVDIGKHISGLLLELPVFRARWAPGSS